MERGCRRAPLFALSASSDPPFGASYSCAPRALHELPNASTVRQNSLGERNAERMITPCAVISRMASLKNEDAAPAARVPKSVTHLKVDAEILDIHLGKTLPPRQISNAGMN